MRNQGLWDGNFSKSAEIIIHSCVALYVMSDNVKQLIDSERVRIYSPVFKCLSIGYFIVHHYVGPIGRPIHQCTVHNYEFVCELLYSAKSCIGA